MINEVRVTYMRNETDDPAVWGEDVAQAQDIAVLQASGIIRSETIAFPYIRSNEVAQRVAERSLRMLRLPKATATFYETTRQSALWRPGTPFKLVNVEHGVASVLMRVANMDYGEYENDRVRIEAIQDVFALPGSFLSLPPAADWDAPSTDDRHVLPTAEEVVTTTATHGQLELILNDPQGLVYSRTEDGIEGVQFQTRTATGPASGWIDNADTTGYKMSVPLTSASIIAWRIRGVDPVTGAANTVFE